MTDSPGDTHPPFKDQQMRQEEESKNQTMKTHEQKQQRQRLCDYCNHSTALLYCRADSAKLCFSCDREVHSTNRLFSKHRRSQLCDACDQSPASIFCETEHSVLCQNCDWKNHKLSLSSIHNRRPIEGFNGCPTVSELVTIVGLEDLGKKALFLSEESDGINNCNDGLVGFCEDFFFWDTPAFASLDDLIVSADSDHNFQALGVPSLPKNRNVACGQHKEEILHQLRELAKLEPNLNYENVDAEPIIGFQTLVHEQNLQPVNMYTGCENDVEPISFPAYEASALQRFSDSGEAANQEFLPSTLLRGCFEENSTVPDKQSDIGGSLSRSIDGPGEQSQHPITTGTISGFSKVAQHEPNSQDRDSAISRYKEKKKTRRFDKHVRYESRKVRAESRIRIKGRFAKTDH